MKHFALAGNPNCGKTTLFNNLTGSTAHVGNWPGVTVEKREGIYKKLKEPVSIVDLPGIYSLSPYSPEEIISRNYLLQDKVDCIINILDVTNLERNLYLTTQLAELDIPLVVALNMSDLLTKNGDIIDIIKLSELLNVKVVSISALKGTNLDELMRTAYQESNKIRKGKMLFNSSISELIDELKGLYSKKNIENPLFHAIKMSEEDEIEIRNNEDIYERVVNFKKNFANDNFEGDYASLLADERYRFIEQNSKKFFHRKQTNEKIKMTRSDKIDKILTNRFFGLLIFAVILFFIFHFTFAEDFLYLHAMGLFGDGLNVWPDVPIVGGVIGSGNGINSLGVMLQTLMINTTDWITSVVRSGLESLDGQSWVTGFICDGVLGGLFAVLSFVPQILLLFLFFSILEDTGYMARVAFILDRLFRKFGLSGRAFMPMIMGFGCSVPAIINTRTLADDNERTATIRVIPFFSCGAKLPILTAVSGAIVTTFGIGNADLITFGMYILGMVSAIVAVILMRNTTMRGPVPMFIMELPSYHVPQIKSLMIHLWDKLKHFMKKAFTIILVSTIIIWAMSHFSFSWQYLSDEEINNSILAGIGMLFQPLFTPLGWGSQLGAWGWVFCVGAVTGLIAKENVIATFSSLAACITAGFVGTEEGILEVEQMILATNIAIPGLISFIAFNMLTIPCFAAVATAKAELPKNKFKTTILFWLVFSYIVSMMIYLIGSYWWTLFIFLALIALMAFAIHYINMRLDKKRLANESN